MSIFLSNFDYSIWNFILHCKRKTWKLQKSFNEELNQVLLFRSTIHVFFTALVFVQKMVLLKRKNSRKNEFMSVVILNDKN